MDTETDFKALAEELYEALRRFFWFKDGQPIHAHFCRWDEHDKGDSLNPKSERCEATRLILTKAHEIFGPAREAYLLRQRIHDLEAELEQLKNAAGGAG